MAFDIDDARAKFLQRFQDPNEILSLDPDREDTYVWLGHTKWSTEDAVENLFSDSISESDAADLIDDLNETAPDWVDRTEG